MGSENSHWPSFLVTIDDADFTQKLRIPTEFIQDLNENVPFVSLLRTSSSWRGWCVKVKYEEGNLFFRKGWLDFAEDYFLELGESIIFKYKGDSQFYVEVYGKNGGRKELPSSKAKSDVEHKDDEANRGSNIIDSDCNIFGLRKCVKRKRMALENSSDKELRSSKAKGRFSKSHTNVGHIFDEVNRGRGSIGLNKNVGGSCKCDEPAERRTAIENDGTETPEPASSFKEETPYFILSWKQEMKYQAKIPTKFLREVGEELSDIVFLEDSIGRVWCIGLRKADGGVWFQKDWEEFIEHQSILDQQFLYFRYHGDSQFYVLTLSNISASEMMHLDDSGHHEEPNISKRCRSREEDRIKSVYGIKLSCKKRNHSLGERLDSRYKRKRRGDDQEKASEISGLGEANHEAQQGSEERIQSSHPFTVKPEWVIIEEKDVISDELPHERKRRVDGEEKATEIFGLGESNQDFKQGSEERTQSIEPEFVNIEAGADELPDERKRNGDDEEKVRDISCLGVLNQDVEQGSAERTQSIEPQLVIIEEKELSSDELPDERKRRGDDEEKGREISGSGESNHEAKQGNEERTQSSEPELIITEEKEVSSDELPDERKRRGDNEEKAREISGLGESNQEAKQGSEERTQSIEFINIEKIEVVNVEDSEVSSDELPDGRKRRGDIEGKARGNSGLGESNQEAKQGSEERTHSIKPEFFNIEEKEVVNIEDNEVSPNELPDGRKTRGDDEEKAREISALGESNQDAKQRSEEINQSTELEVVDIEEKEMSSDELPGERKRRGDGEEKARKFSGLSESNQEAKQGSDERTQSIEFINIEEIEVVNIEDSEVSLDGLLDGRKRRGDDEEKAREISGLGESNQEAKQGSEETAQSKKEVVNIEDNEVNSDELPDGRKGRGVGESNQDAKQRSEERNQSIELEVVDIEEKTMSSDELPGEKKRRGDGEEKVREISGLDESNQYSKQGSEERTQSIEPESVNIEDKDVSSSDELPDDLDESNQDKQRSEKSSPYQGNETAGSNELEWIDFDTDEPTVAKKNYYSSSLKRKGNKINNQVARLASAFKSQHPFFIAVIWGSYLSKGCLHVPSSFTQAYLSKRPVTVKLVRDSKTWTVKCYFRSNSTLFTRGWTPFARDTGLEEGDVCAFELIETNAATMQVSIFRVVDDELTMI